MGKNLGDSNSDQELGKHNHVIRINDDYDVNNDRLACMKRRTLEQPKLLINSAGRSSCSIFRVPQRFVEINGRVYEPHVVSIGPYHHGKPHLRMVEEHKWRFLGSLLSRTQIKGLTLEDYVRNAKQFEQRARESYSETISMNSDEFTEMMVLDGCFIIEIFRIAGNLVQSDPQDPILTMSWLFPSLLRDLLRLENQIPFFILQSLFDLSKMSSEENSGEPSPSLSMLALEFFNHATMERPPEIIQRYRDHEPKHLLDLLRSTFTNSAPQEPQKARPTTQVNETVTKLRRAGITFKQRNAESFLDVNFRNGVLEMPAITIDDFTTSFLANCVVFEQCHNHCSKHVTTYATLLDCLINTYRDVEFLCDAKIIDNYFGTEGDLARFLNNLGKDMAFDFQRSYLSSLFDEINVYYRNGWHVQWASFKYTYFDTPWSFISAVAAVILLFLTMIQTFYSAYPQWFPSKDKCN